MNVANEVEVEAGETEAVMVTTDQYGNIQGHLHHGVAAHHLPDPNTVVLRPGVKSIHTYLEDVMAENSMAECLEDRQMCEDLLLYLYLAPEHHPGGGPITTMILVQSRVTMLRVDHRFLSVRHSGGMEGGRAQGAVIELDPFHRQIPLAHDLPEEPDEDASLHQCLADTVLHEAQGMNNVGDDRHHIQGHVLVH